ncbi:tripartite tricarboxylate transporter substrate binding protein [Variovorax sp. J31P207]|uniref:Bug family tripartite tricarboxylate transporter substrate binding protein n=1 Tax=Variovorax sp. J31P207 TaxID=3053510 RepID=UPI0025759C5E|nr:tripartite tricarboxylate transporter substrate binding protein [Variovorax sp. J31P207]MDM0071421.1 tripartite tricarboxylate transporter substrate binding protein [Variovorax sp. J31P207]
MQNNHTPTPSGRRLALKAAGTVMLSAIAAGAQTRTHAQVNGAFPDRAARLILPYPPGGSTDTIARLITQELASEWKQPMIVDNRPGASGMIGTEMAAKAAPDGYTALFAITQHIQNPLLYVKVPYDPVKDFVPVTRILTVPTALAVSADLPVRNAQELLALIRSQPGRHSYGSTGIASTSHIYGSLLDKTAKLNAVHVAYKGAGPMLSDLLGRQITFTIVDIGSLSQQVKTGKLKLLAVSGTQRVEAFRDVPTFAEAGMRDFETVSWMGIFLPAGTPRAIRDKWATSLQRYLGSPEFASRIAVIGMTPNPSGPADFSAQIAREVALWRNLISIAQVKAE